jgi:glycosyltransferase involved in cell wall biosynthesis
MNTQMNILFFSTFPPRECGIATFTKDLMFALKKVDPSVIAQHITISDTKEGYKYSPDIKVLLDIHQSAMEEYDKAADYANRCDADVINIQHEFGIFGGFDGYFLLRFLKKVKVPAIITWHTVPMTKEAKRREKRLRLMKELMKYSKASIGLTKAASKLIVSEKIALAQKSFYIPHGAPFFDLKRTNEVKRKLGLSGKMVIGTQGMVSENKGLEYVIEALPEIVKKYKNITYLIIGTSHPLKPRTYYEDLKKLVAKKNLKKYVQFIDRYLSLEEVVEYLLAVDIHITPYLVPEQVSSGVLCYSVAAGNYNIATPFSYAKEVLANGRGVLVPFRDPKSIARAVLEAIKNPKKLEAISQKAYRYGQQFYWESVAKNYLKIFQKVKTMR